ncbi:MAG TPA: hypothetical protein VMC41_02375 [Candidatus Nanoarchaeia archaeon]|nr:hypothetical protein [Candidatus Nanoarchaeia archaeon]
MNFKEENLNISRKLPVPLEQEFLPAREEKIPDLDEVLYQPEDKLVRFGGGTARPAIIQKENADKEKEINLSDLSEKVRRFLNFRGQSREKDELFAEIKKAQLDIARQTGAKKVIYGFDGDIIIIRADDSQEKIFDNSAEPLISAATGEEAEIFSNGSEIAGTEKKEKEFRAEDYNVPGDFADAEAAAALAKKPGYLDLSQVTSISAEALRALRPKIGMINLLALESESVDKEARKVLKSFVGTVLLQDQIRRRVDES